MTSSAILTMHNWGLCFTTYVLFTLPLSCLIDFMPVHEKNPGLHLPCLHLQCNTEFSCALTLLTEIIPKFSFPLLLQEMLKSHFQLNLTWSTMGRIHVFLSDLIMNTQHCKSKALNLIFPWMYLYNQQTTLSQLSFYIKQWRQQGCLLLYCTCSHWGTCYLASLCHQRPSPGLPEI